MKAEIFPIKKIPEIQNLAGDYYITQSALILSALADGETRLKNFNRGVDTDRTIEFLKSLGYEINRDDEEISIEAGHGAILPDSMKLKFNGDIFPLSLIIGLLAGFNQSCVLEYSSFVNQDIIDRMVDVLNQCGIDLLHRADSRTIVVRAGMNLPVETSVRSSNSCLKNCLLMFGISSGNSVTIREVVTSPGYFENSLRKFGARITVNDAQLELKKDPIDPRKKRRIIAVNYKRELILPAAINIQSADIEIPCDYDIVMSFLTLAVLKKKDITIRGVMLNSDRMRFIDHLRSVGVEVGTNDRKTEGGYTIATLIVQCKRIKARKFSGEHTSALIDDIPFMAVLAALGAGTTIIRSVGEFNDWGIEPFGEIADNLGRMGVKCGILRDGLAIEGTGEINGANFGPFRNRKIALAFYIVALAGQGLSKFDGFDVIEDNYPDVISMIRDTSRGRVTSKKVP